MIEGNTEIKGLFKENSNLCVQQKKITTEDGARNVDEDVDVILVEGSKENTDAFLDKLAEENNIDVNQKEIKNKKIASMKTRIKFSNNDNIFLTIYTIIGYFFTSIAIIYYNHWLFDKVAPYPVFATWVQQVVGVCCFGLVSLSRKTPQLSRANKNEVKYSDSNNKNGDSTSKDISITTVENEANKNLVLEITKVSNDEDLSSEINLSSSEKEKCLENKEKSEKKFLAVISSEIKKLLKILPMSICFVGLVAFGNICLKYVQVSTYQLARSGSLIFTVIVSYFMLGQVQTWQSILACIIVCAGFLIGSLDRSSLSIMGIITGLASSFCQVFYNVFMKKCMNYFNGDATELMKYNQCISTILLIPCIFIAQELNLILNSAIFDVTQAEFFRLWVLLIICGLLSMLLNYFTFLVVGYTSPVTFNVLGMFKSCAQTAGGFIIFHDKASVHSVTGICLTLAGSVWYGFAKSTSCKSRDKNELQKDVDSENMISCKTIIDQKTSNILKELTKMEELDYSNYLNIKNKESKYSKSSEIVNEVISNAEMELMILSSNISSQQLEINENRLNHLNLQHNTHHLEESDVNHGIKLKNWRNQENNDSKSLSSCISNNENSNKNVLTNVSKSSEQLNLARLFDKFTEFSREGSTELRTSMSKISVSLPASVYASPTTESRHISIDGIPGNKFAELSNENVSDEVSILIDSEKEIINNNCEHRSFNEEVYDQESDEEKSTIMATIY